METQDLFINLNEPMPDLPPPVETNSKPQGSPKKKKENEEKKNNPEGSKKKRRRSKKDSENEDEKPKKKRGRKKGSTNSNNSRKIGPVPKEGDIVWAKMDPYPWWPGRVIEPASVILPPEAEAAKTKTSILVYFFGSHDYSYIEKKFVVHFKKHLKDYSKTKKPELIEAISEALKEYNDEKLIEEFDDFEDTSCQVCKNQDNPDKLLLCDNCDAAYHTYCLEPPLKSIPAEDWFCADCSETSSDRINVDSVTVTKIKNGIFGLVNLGSTCYINSTIQSLNGCLEFRTNLLNLQIPQQGILYSLQNVFKNLWDSSGVSHRLLRDFKTQCGTILNKKYLGMDHQDINEFLMEVLETSHQELKKLQSSQESSQNTLIESCFEGRLVRTRTCPNGHSSKSYESFRILPLQFPLEVKTPSDLNRSFLNLTDMIQDLSAEEKLECRCETCGGNQDYTFKQKTEIDKFSPILIIQLARFMSFLSGDDGDDWWSNKIESEVKFPLTNFDLTKQFPNYPKDITTPIFDLFTVVNHEGGTRGGHWWANVKHDNIWYSFNDHTVKQITEKEVASHSGT